MAKVKAPAPINTTIVGGDIPIGTPVQPVMPDIADQEFLATTVETVAKAGEQGAFSSEQADLKNKFDEIAKLRRAADQGRISFTEARTRASASVKEAINNMPWRAKEFRQQASTYFGAYGEGWGLMNRTAAEQESSSMAQSLELSYRKQFKNLYGKRWDTATAGNLADMQVHAQVKMQAEVAKNIQQSGDITQSNALDIIDTQARPMVTETVGFVSKHLQNFTLNGKTISERVAEGESMSAIINRVQRDETLSRDLADGVIDVLRQRKLAITQFYDNQLDSLNKEHKMVFDSISVKSRKDALLSNIDSMIEDVRTNGDKKALTKLVTSLETSNRGHIASFNAANINFTLAKRSGYITDDAITRYIEDPNMIRNPQLRSLLDRVLPNLKAAEMSNWMSEIAILPRNYETLYRTNKDLADVIDVKARSTMPIILSTGFSNDPQEKETQQDWFVTSSYITLFKTDSNSPKSVEHFEKSFFDPQYLERFKQLPADKQAKILEPARRKVGNVLMASNGVVQRVLDDTKGLIRADVDFSMGADGKIKVGAKTLARTASQSSDISNMLVDNVSRLNRYLELFEAISPDSVNMEEMKAVILDTLQKGSVFEEKPKQEEDEPKDGLSRR